MIKNSLGKVGSIIPGIQSFRDGILLPTKTGIQTLLEDHEVYNHVTTLTTNGTAPTPQAVTMRFERIGKIVTMTVPSTYAVGAGTGTPTHVKNSDIIPGRFLPVTNVTSNFYIHNNYAWQTTLGYFYMSTDGYFRIYRDMAETAYTISAACGCIGFSMSWLTP